jgi:hypothetical protein
MKFQHGRRMGLVVAAALLIACPGGMTDYRRDLTHGYKLVRANADEYVIVDSMDGVVVTPTISEIGHVGDVIVGVTELPQRQGNFGSKPGYFVVNTATGETRMGLSKDACLAELRRYGIDDEPTLRRPSRTGEL